MTLSNSGSETTNSQNDKGLLRFVPYSKGFHFFRSIGNYTGETATSLFCLLEMLKAVEVGSVEFHFRRSDFGRWIREVIGDGVLADRLDGLGSNLCGEPLRMALVAMVQARVEEL